MTDSRLRAPAADGALLAIPSLHESVRIASDNRSSLLGWDYDVQGRSVRWLRVQARAEAVDAARRYMERLGLSAPPISADDPTVDDPRPWIVTGHQPELFHPGVWVKNFAAGAIARRADGVAVNVVVDNDLPKSSAVFVPAAESGRFRRIGVDYDVWSDHETPFEDLSVESEEAFASFPERVRSVLGNLVADPLLNEFWPLATSRRDEIANVGARFVAARHAIESRWGTTNLEVPLSRICETDSFLWFLSHLLAQLPRFQAIHNAALAEYRRRHRIRSRHHPVPPLEARDGWLEAPFWAWRADRPRRHPLLARQVGRRIELRIACEDDVLLDLPLGPDREACCAVEQLRELKNRSIRIRTRALTTTMFLRLFLGDLFLHGIGGAKYDELGDAIARRFLGFPPPKFLTLSQTLWLGLPYDHSASESWTRLNRRLRDAEYNPDRLLREPIPVQARSLIEAKRRAVSGPQETRPQRVERWRELRRVNEALQSFIEDQRNGLEARLRDVRLSLRNNRIASNREYALVLHSSSKLTSAMNRPHAELALNSMHDH